MPSRFLSLGIIAFWLASTGWLIYRDVWARFSLTETAPFTIDLAQEARTQAEPVVWTVLRKGQRIGEGSTWVTHREADDTYELHSKFKFTAFSFSVLNAQSGLSVERMESMYRVTRDGDLREISAETGARLRLVGNAQDVRVRVSGLVEDHVFTPHWNVEPSLGKENFQTQPVEVKNRYSMLNPLQPWNRLLRIQPGENWQLCLFDPLTDSLASLTPLGGSGPSFLEAGVLEVQQDLFWNHRSIPCWVIECRGDQIRARTWVRASDGLVMRQEVTRGRVPHEETLALERGKK